MDPNAVSETTLSQRRGVHLEVKVTPPETTDWDEEHGDDETTVLIGSDRGQVYALLPVPFEKQIEALLSEKRVEEAIQLAESVRADMEPKRFAELHARLLVQSGFVELSRANWPEARRYFKEGQLNIMDLLSVYPWLIPNELQCQSKLDISIQLDNQNEEIRRRSELFLMEMLDEYRELHQSSQQQSTAVLVDSVLANLFAMHRGDQLIALLTGEYHCLHEWTVKLLEEKNCHFAKGLLLDKRGEKSRAMDVWCAVVDGKLKDNIFPGIEFIIEYLACTDDARLIWNHAEWAMERDAMNAVRIFTRAKDLNADQVLQFLRRWPQALCLYLEHLVLVEQRPLEELHTQLALLYLSRVLQLLHSGQLISSEDVVVARRQLQHLLRSSSMYRVQLLLSKLKDTELFIECATLHGKLGQHDQALRLLVHRLNDFEAAESYCRQNGDEKQLTQLLLSIYLEPGASEKLVAPALRLLNSEMQLHPLDALKLIPEHWGIRVVQQFLSAAVRDTLHLRRNTQVQRALENSQRLTAKGQLIQLQSVRCSVSESQTCGVCRRPLGESVFVRMPDGALRHPRCAGGESK